MPQAANGNGPQGQQNGQQGTGTGDNGDIDLDLDLDGDQSGDGGDGGGDQSGDGSGDGDQLSIEQQIQQGIQAAIPTITASFQSEMDRRINSALNKGQRRQGNRQDQQQQQEQQEQGQQNDRPADVRGARLAFREYLPESIRLFSEEERALAREYGQGMIASRAAQGFEDEDEVGREVAVATADFLKRARGIYSARTKAVLERQGVLITGQQGGGQSPHGQVKGAPLEAAYDKARKKDMELFPDRYANQQQ